MLIYSFTLNANVFFIDLLFTALCYCKFNIYSYDIIYNMEISQVMDFIQ